MDQKIIDLYDDYVHRHFDRRLFLDRLAKAAGGMSAALTLLPLLQSNYALAETVKADDPRIKTSHVTFDGVSGPMQAYLARPVGGGKRGGVLVIHQNRGLNPHIEDVARRVATDGYVALAVDFLSPLGGTPKDEQAAMQMFGKLNKAQTTSNGIYALAYLRKLPGVNGKVGAMGFCWGGGVVNQLAVNAPGLDAGVCYYGSPADPSEAVKVKAPLLFNMGDASLDKRLGDATPPYGEALKAAGKDYQLYFYEGANHAFNDDTNAARYNKAAADLAWSRTIALFKRTLA